MNQILTDKIVKILGYSPNNFEVTGQYDSLEIARSEIPEPYEAQGIAVGIESPYDIYIWNGAKQDWLCIGAFQGPKGEQGEQGLPGPQGARGETGKQGIDGFSPFIDFVSTENGYEVKVTNKNSYNVYTLKNGDKGDKGDKGDTGEKGNTGDTGRGITSINKTSGTTTSGVTDTYTINYSDNTTSEFNVYNGKDGISPFTPYTTATISTSAWSGTSAPYSASITINGLSSAYHPIVWLNPSSTYSTAANQIAQWKYIYRVTINSSNKLVLYSSVKPTVSLPIQFICIK